jgi:hypothetical protein
MEQSFGKDLEIRNILINITDVRHRDNIVLRRSFPSSGKFWGVLMSTLQRLSAINDATANLIAQIHELNELREQVRKAELSARRSRPIGRRKITFSNQRRRLPLARLHQRNLPCR